MNQIVATVYIKVVWQFASDEFTGRDEARMSEAIIEALKPIADPHRADSGLLYAHTSLHETADAEVLAPLMKAHDEANRSEGSDLDGVFPRAKNNIH